MNRRGFLKALGVGTAAAACAGSIGMAGFDWIDTGESSGFATPILTEYADYTNFSQMAISTAMDETIQKVAKELGEAHAKRINWLVEGKLPPFWSDDDE